MSKQPESVEVQENPVNWPVDENQQPLAQVSWSMHELINLGNYSNVTVGPVRVTRFAKDSEVEKGLDKCKEEVETSLAKERQLILDAINAQKKASE